MKDIMFGIRSVRFLKRKAAVQCIQAKTPQKH
jgi:hypothetical protein